MGNLATAFSLPPGSLEWLTSAVQFGFIVGTLVFAILSLADRFSPSRVFLWAALAGAFFNTLATLDQNTLATLIGGRFLTGFCLAGIYPVGMKIAADYFDKGLGKSLGFLVGALVLGTAFPHLIRAWGANLPWTNILYGTSGLAIAGGLLIGLLVPNGPHRRSAQRPDFSAFFRVFAHRPFRRAAFGYFGHMWELYAFWTFVPLMIGARITTENDAGVHPSWWAFAVIATGSLGCVAGGLLSQRLGPRLPARTFLVLSGLCCLLYPVFYYYATFPILLGFLLFWGFVVVGDSPLFSTLVAQNARPEWKGTALTVVNCIGFAITILSIQLLGSWWPNAHPMAVTILGIGPLLGVWWSRE